MSPLNPTHSSKTWESSTPRFSGMPRHAEPTDNSYRFSNRGPTVWSRSLRPRPVGFVSCGLQRLPQVCAMKQKTAKKHAQICADAADDKGERGARSF